MVRQRSLDNVNAIVVCGMKALLAPSERDDARRAPLAGSWHRQNDRLKHGGYRAWKRSIVRLLRSSSPSDPRPSWSASPKGTSACEMRS